MSTFELLLTVSIALTLLVLLALVAIIGTIIAQNGRPQRKRQ
jgi:cytochrome c biogenesis protein ResB